VSKKNRRRVSCDRRAVRVIGANLVLLGLVILPACSYLETLEQPTGKGDGRARLGATDALLLLPKEVPHYACKEPLILTCEKGGGLKYYCHCVLY